MKKPFFNALLITLLLTAPVSLFTAASSSAGRTPAQSELESILTVVAPLLQNVTHNVLAAYTIDPTAFKNGDYYLDSETQQKLKPQLFGPKTTESEQELRIQLDSAFEQGWPIYAANSPGIAPLKNDIKSAMINFFIQSEFYRLLTTCECISKAKRISFAVLTAHQLMAKNPDPKQKIVVTAFASGLLLQEFLLLKLLEEHGYRNVTANFVDFGYPDPVAFRRVLNQFKKLSTADSEYERIALKHYKQELIRASGITAEQEYESSSSEQASSSESESKSDEENENAPSTPKKTAKEFQQEWIKENKELFPEFAELFGDDYFGSPLTFQKAFNRVQQLLPNTALRSYKDAHDYIQFVKKYAHRADMLTIVDPDLQVFDVAPFPSQANLLGLIPSSETLDTANPDVFITLAKDQPVQLYVNKAAYTADEFIRQNVIAKIRAYL